MARITTTTLWHSTFYVDITYGNYDIDKNQTVVTWRAGLNVANNDQWYSNAVKLNAVTINGTKVYSGGTFSNIKTNGDHELANGTITITHNDSGEAKNIPVSLSGWLYSYGDTSGSGTFDLPTIPRKTSCPTFSVAVEKSINIGLSPKSSSFSHKIKLTFGGTTEWLNTTGGLSSSAVTITTTSPLFNCPVSYYKRFSGASATGTITLYTYNGSTLIGSEDNTFTINADVNTCKPYIVGTLVDSNSTTIALSGNSNDLIKGYSTGLIKLTTKRASSANDSNASISSLIINGVSVDTSTTTYSINNIATNTVTIIATNSRGTAYKDSFTISSSGLLIDYIPLTLASSQAYYRPQPTTGEVKADLKGNYFGQQFGTGKTNTLTVKIYYRKKGTTDWTSLSVGTVTKNTTSYSYSASLGTTYDYQTQYEFRTVLTDKLTTVDNIYSVSEGIPVFWWDNTKIQMEKELVLKGGSNIFSFNKIVTGLNLGVGSTTSYSEDMLNAKLIVFFLAGKATKYFQAIYFKTSAFTYYKTDYSLDNTGIYIRVNSETGELVVSEYEYDGSTQIYGYGIMY
jgi:hypothetical protein